MIPTNPAPGQRYAEPSLFLTGRWAVFDPTTKDYAACAISEADARLLVFGPDVITAARGVMASIEVYRVANSDPEEDDEYSAMMRPLWLALIAALANATGQPDSSSLTLSEAPP